MIFKSFNKLKKSELKLIINEHYNFWLKYASYLNFTEERNKFIEVSRNTNKLPIGFALFNDNELIGFACIALNNIKAYKHLYLWITNVLILEKHRHKGYGKIIINHCLEIAKNLNYEKIYVWTTTAPKFYESIGFDFIENFNHYNKIATLLSFNLTKKE